MFFRKHWQDVLRVTISLLCIAGSIYFLQDKWVHSLKILKGLDLRIFAFACLLFFLINLIVCVRLWNVLQIAAIRVPLGRIVYLNFIGLFFNLFLPSSVGGDAVKAYYLSMDAGAKMKTVSAVIVDRLLGLAAVVLVAVVALPFFARIYQDPKVVASVLVVGMGFAFFALLFFNSSLASRFKFVVKLIPSSFMREKVSDFYRSMTHHRSDLGKLLYCYGLSVIVQMVAIFMGFLISRSVGLDISFLIFMVILPVTSIISMLPSLGGLGVREASVIYFLTAYSSVEHATAFILAYDILIYGFGLSCGILYALVGGRQKIRSTQSND